MGSSDIRHTKVLHCLLNNSGFFRNGTGKMSLKYILTKIKASHLPHSFVSSRPSESMLLIPGKRGKKCPIFMCTRTPDKRLMLELLPHAMSPPADHPGVFPLLPQQRSRDTFAFSSCILWSNISPQKKAFCRECSSHRQAVRPWETQLNVREILYKVQPQLGKEVLKLNSCWILKHNMCQNALIQELML